MRVLSVLILVVMSTSVSPNLIAQNDSKEQAFAKVLQLDSVAASIREAEKQAEGKRKDAYKTAAQAVREYISKWENSRTTVENLREYYRLAIYLELAGDKAGAQAAYRVCSTHPMLNDPNATWTTNGVEHRITDLVLPHIVPQAREQVPRAIGTGASGCAGPTCGGGTRPTGP